MFAWRLRLIRASVADELDDRAARIERLDQTNRLLQRRLAVALKALGAVGISVELDEPTVTKLREAGAI